MMNQEKIGKFIAALRKEKNMTQEQLAEKLGTSNRSISRWENGKTMPDLSMLPLVCEVLEISIEELLNGERLGCEPEMKECIGLMLELYDREKQNKIRFVNQCFFAGLICIGIVMWNQGSNILRFAKEPKLLEITLLLLGIGCEAAGFYFNSKKKRYTEQEMFSFLGSKEKLHMKSAGEMLQFAKRMQNVDLKQYEKAFHAISEKLLPEEFVKFSMVADTFLVNESWTDAWKPWHVSVAVTEGRLLVCGEAIHGRFMTFYDVESFELEGLSSVQFQSGKIVIEFEKEKLTLEGKGLEILKNSLEKALKFKG